MDFEQIKNELEENDRDVIGRMLYDALDLSYEHNLYTLVEKSDGVVTTVGIRESNIRYMVELVNRAKGVVNKPYIIVIDN